MRRILKTFSSTLLLIVIFSATGLFAQSPEIYFLHQKSNQRIVELFGEATRSISVLSYVITNRSIAEALTSASNRGITVRVILDEDQFHNNRYSLGNMLMNGEIKLKLINSDKWRLISDYGIIDEEVVYTGGAMLHSEMGENPKLGNFLVFNNDENVITQFMENFTWIYISAHSANFKK